MSCKYCNRIFGHEYRCPNYNSPKSVHHCAFCVEGIYANEEYIVNQDVEYRHYDCFYSTKDILNWLGYEIKIMEEIYERDY